MYPIVDDEDYLATLPPGLYRNRYFLWKEKMLGQIDSIKQDLVTDSLESVMTKYNLTPRDIALLVRLNYISEEDSKLFGLDVIEKSVPA